MGRTACVMRFFEARPTFIEALNSIGHLGNGFKLFVVLLNDKLSLNQYAQPQLEPSKTFHESFEVLYNRGT